MDVVQLDVERREAGKKHARAIRRAEKVPCVLYGHRTEPVHFSVDVLALRPLIYTQEMHRVQVALDGEQWDCILKDVDFHPVTDIPVHADFLALEAGQTLTLTIPFRFEGTPVGQKGGGDTQKVLTEVEVRCLPKDIPDHITVHIADLDVGEAIHISDLEVEGVEFVAPPRQTVVTIVAPRREPVLEEEEAELAAAEAMLEGEEVDTAETPTDEKDQEGEEA